MFINSDELNNKYKTDISQGIKSGQEIQKDNLIDDKNNKNTNEQIKKNKKDKFNTVALSKDVIINDSKNLKEKLTEKMCKSIKNMDLKNANMNEIEDIIKNKKNIIKEPK